MQWDAAGYSRSAAKWMDIESIQGYTGYQGYGEICGMHVKYRRDIPKIHSRGGLLPVSHRILGIPLYLYI